MCALKRASVKNKEVEPKKGVVEKTKEEKEYEIELRAKEKVSKLLEDMPVESVVVKTDKLQDSKEKKTVEWMEEQIQMLTDQNAKLEAQNDQLKNDYNKLFDQYQSSPSADSDHLKRGIEEIFFELDATLRGLRYGGVAYEEAKIRPLLNNFMAKFPFLQNVLKARMAKR